MLKNKNKTNSTCHTRPDRVSMDSRIQSENDICGESGRSMVEMLGVLAVIGGLSIGGIAGYNTAMNKHRANNILNAASQRAMVVSAQIQRDASASPSLAEFASSNTVNDATFGESVTYTGSSTTTFALTLSGLGSDNAICTQMKNIAGTDGNVNVSDDCSTLTYNTDLSAPLTTTQNACTTAGKSWCAALNKCQNTGATCACPDTNSEYKETGGDPTKQISGTNCYCKTNYKLQNGACVQIQNLKALGAECSDGTECASGICYQDITGSTTVCTGCLSGSDCSSGQFCNKDYTLYDYFVCDNPAGNFAVCYGNQYCLSGNCSEWKCQGKENGASCSVNDECLSEICTNKQCIGRTSGETCNNDGECASNSCKTTHKCE